MSRLKEDEKQERARQDKLELESRLAKKTQQERYDLIKFFKAHEHEGICLEANVVVLLDFLAECNLQVNFSNLEYAYEEVKDQLAVKPPEPYQRKTERARVPMAQQTPVKDDPAKQPRPVVLPYSREEILKMSPEELRKLMQKKEYLDDLNRTLGLRR